MTLLAYFCAGLLAYVPFVALLISLYCLVRAINSANQTTTVQQPGIGRVPSNEKVPIWRLFSFLCFVALLALAIVMFFHTKASYANVNC